MNLELPFDLELERLLLGSASLVKECAVPICTKLDESDFYNSDHQTIFAAMCKILAKDVDGINIATLGSELKASNPDRASELTEKVMQAQEKTILYEVTGTNWSIDRLKFMARRRSIMKFAYRCVEIGRDGESEEDPIDRAMGELASVGVVGKTTGATHIRDFITKLYDRLESGNRPREIVKTGFIDLDRRIGGFFNGDLAIIAGRPGMGKTAFAAIIAKNIADDGPVLYVTLELPMEALCERLLAYESNVTSEVLQTEGIANKPWDKLSEGTTRLSGTELYLANSPTIDEIKMEALRIEQITKKKMRAIFIDRLELLGDNVGKNLDETQTRLRICRKVKRLTNAFGCPVTLVCQLNRGPEDRFDHRPMLRDLQQTGAIEQDAQLVLFLYRESYYEKETSEAFNNINAEVIVAKNTNGPTGDVSIAWRKEIPGYYNAAPQSVVA